jgi:hypothetical protein
VFAGCSSDFDAGADGTEPDGCAADVDCATGLTCQYGVCAVEPGPELTIALSITPPDFRPDLARQQVAGVPVRLGGQLPDFGLARPVRVNGTVTYDTNSVPAGADVRFESRTAIPGLSVSAIASTDGEAGAFSVEIPPGRYDVTILPSNPSVPRRTLLNVAITTAGTNRCPEVEGTFCQLLPLVLPAPERYVGLRGVLEAREPRITPLAGARVFATSVDSNLESTIAVTDVDGSFTIFVAPEIAEYTIFVRPGDDPSVPSMAFEPFELPDDEGMFDLTLAVPVPTGRGWLEGRIVSPDGVPPADISIVARASLPELRPLAGALTPTEGEWEVRLGATSLDAEGRFAIELPATTWDVFAVAASGSWGPSDVAQIVVVDSAGEPRPGESPDDVPSVAEFVLRERSPSTGRVVSPDSTPVPGAVVTVEPLRVGDIGIDALGVASVVFAAATTAVEDGSFVVPLVDGRYRVTVIPPDGPGLARAEFEREVIDGSGLDELALPTSGVVVGRILDESQQPLAGANIEAWLVRAAGAERVGTTTTDGAGEYRLVLPANAE